MNNRLIGGKSIRLTNAAAAGASKLAEMAASVNLSDE